MIERASLALLTALACLAAGPAYADCTSPAGKEADRIYNSDYHTLQFCNGTNWVPFSGALASGGGGAGCSNPAGKEADVIYNGGSYHTWQFCNGTNWVAFGSIPAACTSCNIFGSTVPSTVDGGPDSSTNLGVVFYSEVPGNITGIRFYKASANTGTHKGYLWDINGSLLAQVTFSGETASGWQTMSFASPVAIQAYTLYVAAYSCPNGHYSVGSVAQNFGSAETVNLPLHAAEDGGDDSQYTTTNGRFVYAGAGNFPDSTFESDNYFVDVVFSQ